MTYDELFVRIAEVGISEPAQAAQAAGELISRYTNALCDMGILVDPKPEHDALRKQILDLMLAHLPYSFGPEFLAAEERKRQLERLERAALEAEVDHLRSQVKLLQRQLSFKR